MRKKTAFLLALAVMISMTACQDKERGLPDESSMTQAEESDITQTEENSMVQAEGVKKTPENIIEQDTVSDAGSQSEQEHVLIAYFSRWGNTDYPEGIDASTSASIVDSGGRYGTTEYVANLIRQTVGGDLHLIETAVPYTVDFDELRDVNHEEMQQNFLPELKESDLDVSQYDTVFIGYPVWATEVPQAVLSFLDEYDLSGKTVIPFCTHDGYGAGSSYDTIREASHAAQSPEGLALEAKDVPAAGDAVAAWLREIGIAGESIGAENEETDITITVGDTVLDGVLYDTALAQEIKEYFPLTISMSGFGGREYYGGVNFYPAEENLAGGGKTFENGDITYCEAHHNMAIFYAQTDHPNLSVDVIPIGKVTSDLSVFKDFGSSEEITFSLKE